MKYDSDTIEAEGLTNVIPKRKKTSRVKLTINCLKAKNDDAWWISMDEPEEWQIKKMIGLVVASAVEVCMSSHVYIVGDVIYLQADGGPIGLELTGALSRPFMMRWDRLYLKAVHDAGIRMLIYERFVDDSNQVAEKRNADDSDETLAAELTEIANNVMEGIKMECDLPSNHSNQKLPILDMEVWLEEDGSVLYQHYEKPMASKLVISERSAHSNSSKRSVHINELTRRMYNTSRKLNWDEHVAPVLSEYLGRMMAAGYSESYRKDILENALRIWDVKCQKSDDGIEPLNRPKGYRKLERKEKELVNKRQL